MNKTDQQKLKRARPFYYKRGKIGLLLVHGFTGTPYIFYELGQALASQGYTVSAPLLAGHGLKPTNLEQTTWDDWYVSVEAAYRKMTKDCDQIFIVGASVGGALACYLVAKQKLPALKGLILIGVPRWLYRQWLIMIGTPIYVILRIRYFTKPFSKQLNETVIFGGPNFSYLKIPIKSVVELMRGLAGLDGQLLRKIKVPTLIIQSSRDGLVKPQSGTFLFKSLGTDEKELVWITEQHHELHVGKGRHQIYSLITDFIVRWI